MNENLRQAFVRHDEEAHKRHAERLKQANSMRDNAVRLHQRWLEKQEAAALELEQHENMRALVRRIMTTLVERESSEVPLDDLLWFIIRYCAGALACFELDDPIDLKLRRLGRMMQTTEVEF